MQSVQDLIGLVSDKVGDVAQSDVVVGEPIVFGEVTLVPLSRVSIGFGGAGGTGEGGPPRKRSNRHPGRGRGTGGASGGGGKVRPVGVIVFGPDGVDIKPIPDKKGPVDLFFEKVPGLIERIHDIFDGPVDEPAAIEAG